MSLQLFFVTIPKEKGIYSQFFISVESGVKCESFPPFKKPDVYCED